MVIQGENKKREMPGLRNGSKKLLKGRDIQCGRKYIFIFTPPLSARTLGDDSCWIEAFFALKVRISVLNEENYQ